MSLLYLAVVLSVTPGQWPAGTDLRPPRSPIALPDGVDLFRTPPRLQDECWVGGPERGLFAACVSGGEGAERALLLLGPPARAALCLTSGFADYPLCVSFTSYEQARITANMMNGFGIERRVPLPGDAPRPPWQALEKVALPLVGRVAAGVIREGMTVAQVQQILGRPAACVDTPAALTALYPRLRLTVMYRTQGGQSTVEHVFWCGFPG